MDGLELKLIVLFLVAYAITTLIYYLKDRSKERRIAKKAKQARLSKQ